MALTSQINELPLAKQVTVLSKAISHIQLYQFWALFFQHLDYKNVYEVEANLIHINIHIFMNCVVVKPKARWYSY